MAVEGFILEPVDRTLGEFVGVLKIHFYFDMRPVRFNGFGTI